MAHKIRWLLIGLFVVNLQTYCKPQPIVLESILIKMMDGASFGVSGYEIKLMLHILLKLQHMLDGESDGKGNIVGLYNFEGGKYTIKELAHLEIEHEKWGHDDANTSDTQRYFQKKQAFAQCLEEVKKDFDQKVAAFLANARGSKQQLLILIKESCEKHGNPNSHLLKWGDAQDGHETDAMYSDIHTFREFEIFCQDLANFNKDLIHSCPKAVAQYKELKASHVAHSK